MDDESAVGMEVPGFFKNHYSFLKNRLTFMNFDVQKSSMCQNDRQIVSYSMK